MGFPTALPLSENTMLGFNVKYNINPLKGLMSDFHGLSGEGRKEVYVRWIVRYKKFLQTRYRKASSGGGSWPPLSPKTKKRVKKRSRLILIDSKTLFDALRPLKTLARNPAPGAFTKIGRKSVLVGYGSSAKHPTAKMTIHSLALIHQQGRGRVPKRPIIVKPTTDVQKGFQRDVKTVINLIKRRRRMR